jgi:hypothetical protein
VFSQPGMDSHGCPFDIAPGDCTTGTLPVHGVPFDCSPDPALFKDLGHAGPFINHYQEFLGKERAKPLFYVVRSQGNHFIAEIIVNRIIGNNYIYTDRYGTKIFPDL